MGKGEEETLLLTTASIHPPRSSTAMQILCDAAKLLVRSWKPMLPILLIIILPYSFLIVGNYLTITPLIADMVMKFFTMRGKDPRSPEFRQLLADVLEDLRGITGAEAASILISHLLGLLLLMATVYTVAVASRGEQVTLKGLLSRMRRTWMGVVATNFFVFLLSSGYTAVWLVMVAVLSFVSHGSTAVIALDAVIAILAFVLLVYLQMDWSLGQVISVVEDDCYGLAALGRASVLIRGRRRLLFRANLLLILMSTVFVMAFSLVKSLFPSGEKMELVAQLVNIYYSLTMSVFMLAMYVVFFNECEKNQGADVAMKGSFLYTKVPTVVTIDGAVLP